MTRARFEAVSPARGDPLGYAFFIQEEGARYSNMNFRIVAFLPEGTKELRESRSLCLEACGIRRDNSVSAVTDVIPPLPSLPSRVFL